MDPICHTLTGGLLAETGLKRKTAHGVAALVIGANLPDVDVFAAGIRGVSSVAFRRGWTHGVLALVILPVLLAAALLAWDRWRRGRVPARGDPGARFAPLVLLAATAVLSHYLLDFLNVYGIRLLMPFSGRWFYGDALFIADPWMWLMLGGGIVLARVRTIRGRPAENRPALWALAAASLYVLVMLGASVAARQILPTLLPPGVGRPGRVMVAPVPVNPFRRDVVLDMGERYATASLWWTPAPRFELRAEAIDVGRTRPEVAQAAATLEGRQFLSWARFPFFRVERSGAGAIVHIIDLRYRRQPGEGFAAVSIRLTSRP